MTTYVVTMCLIATIWFWVRFVRLLVPHAVSLLAPVNRQRHAVPPLAPVNRQHHAVAAQEEALEDANPRTLTDNALADHQQLVSEARKQKKPMHDSTPDTSVDNAQADRQYLVSEARKQKRPMDDSTPDAPAESSTTKQLQHLTIQTQNLAQQDVSLGAPTDDAPSSPPSLISPDSSTYSSNLSDLDLVPDGELFEFPPQDYIPPTAEDIKRWVGLSFEERRKIHDMQYNGLNWMSWSPPPSPPLHPSNRPWPEDIPEWREEWNDFDVPPDPPHIPSSEALGRWWGEATEEDRARINRICVDGLNWMKWGPPTRPDSLDENGQLVVGPGPGPGPEAQLDPNIEPPAINDGNEQTGDQLQPELIA